MSRPGLHHKLCTNSAEDIKRMQLLIEKWRHELSAESIIIINTALTHAVKSDHDVCVKFLFSQGATVNRRDLLSKVTMSSNPTVFEFLLKKQGWTQEDVNFILKRTMENLQIHKVESEVDNMKLIVKYDFEFEYNFEFLFDPQHPSFDLDRNFHLNLIPLRIDYVYNSFHLKSLLLHGGLVDYRQLKNENLIQREKDAISLLQDFLLMLVWDFQPNQKRKIIILESLQILRQCGSTFAEINANNKSVPDLIEERRKQNEKHTKASDLYDELSKKVQEYMNEPLSLKSLCRLSLMRRLKCCYLKYVNCLSEKECTRDLINFLKGDDMRVTPYMTESEEEILKIKKKMWSYKLLINKHLDVLPLNTRNQLTSEFLSNWNSEDDIDVLKEKLNNLEECGHSIMKLIYKL